VPAPPVPGPAGFFIGLDPPEVTEDEPGQDEPATDRLTQDDLVENELAERDTAVSDPSEPELAENELPEPEAPNPEVAEPERIEREPGTDDLAEDERAEDEPPDSERAEVERVAHETVAHETAEDERAEHGPPEDELVEDEPPEHDAAGSGLSEPEPAEHVVAEAELAEHTEAEPELDAAAAADAQLAEPAAQVPAQEAPAGDAPREDRPDDDAPDDEGPDGYRPDEDLPDENPPPENPPAEDASPKVGPPAPANPWTPPIVVVRGPSSTRPTMVERALSGPSQHRAGNGNGWREHVRVVPGGHGPGRPDMERRDRDRVLLPIDGPRLIVVLGCTVGAGQSVTTLMLADVLATLRAEPVVALDLNPGQTSLTGLARISPAGTARDLLGGSAPIVPGQRGRGRLDLIAHDSAPDGGPALADAEYARVLEVLTSRYPLTLTDPGASAVGRVLSTADQLVLVAPASADAARAVAMTMEWLDGHGYGELCTGAITVINGVSKRSMTHVEQAELVVRGRCRAIVRVPWDDHLGAPPTEQGISDAAADAESRFTQLRPQVQLAYTALAGVLVSALAIGGGRTVAARTSGRTL
jgi:MinD-like ATPase involved in chromosome partitioning or flagellar assembly